MSQLPILLVPGLGCTGELFTPQIPALWPFGPLTIASTLEGDSMAAMAARILADAPQRFVLAGLSMGGYLSFEILRQAPQRVTRLALLDTTARPDLPGRSEFRRGMVARARAGEYEAVMLEAFTGQVHPDHSDDPRLKALMLRMGRAVGVEGFARQQAAVAPRPDSRPLLASIAVPTLVLVGEADALTTPEEAREIAAGIAGARLVVVPGSGHMSTHEQPERVNAALVDLLQGG